MWAEWVHCFQTADGLNLKVKHHNRITVANFHITHNFQNNKQTLPKQQCIQNHNSKQQGHTMWTVNVTATVQYQSKCPTDSVWICMKFFRIFSRHFPLPSIPLLLHWRKGLFFSSLSSAVFRVLSCFSWAPLRRTALRTSSNFFKEKLLYLKTNTWVLRTGLVH